MKKTSFTATLLLAILSLTTSLILSACGGPLGPLGGGKLSGEEATLPNGDWSFAQGIEVVQLETQPADPQSINIWIGVLDDQLYLPTSLILGEEDPAERGWVQQVTANPSIRLRVNGVVYPAQAQRVSDAALIAQVKSFMLQKYEEEATPQSDKAWIYRIDPRP